MSRRYTSLAGDPSPGHRSIKILRFRGPPILGPCKGGVLRPVRHAQRIAPIHAKRHILADRWHLGIIRAESLKSIVILGTPVCKAFKRPELALISLIDHGYNPLVSSKQRRPVALVTLIPGAGDCIRLPLAATYVSVHHARVHVEHMQDIVLRANAQHSRIISRLII